MAHVVMKYTVMAYMVMEYIVIAYIVMEYIVMAYTVMAHIVVAYISTAYIVMANIGMAYIVMAYIVMAYIVMAYIVMDFFCHCLYSYGQAADTASTSQLRFLHTRYFFKNNIFAVMTHMRGRRVRDVLRWSWPIQLWPT